MAFLRGCKQTGCLEGTANGTKAASARETIDDLVKKEMEMDVSNDEMVIKFNVTPQMTNQFGAISYGAFTTLIVESGSFTQKKRK